MDPDEKLKQTIKAAVEHHTAGRLAQAAAAYQQVLAIEPRHFDALQLLGALATQSGKPEMAVELLSRALEVDPAYSTAHCNLASANRALGRTELAIGSYRRAIELEPGNFDAHYNLAQLLRGLGRLDDALASYQTALALKPAFAPTHNDIGAVFGQKGQWNEAVVSLREAISLQPDLVDAHCNLANALTQQGQLAEAFASCRNALALDPDRGEAHFNLGNVLRAQGKPDEAIASYGSASMLMPDSIDPLISQGTVQAERGQWTDAIACFQRAFAIQPEAFSTNYNLALSLSGTGELAKALPYYRKAISLSPESAEVRWAHAMAQIPMIYDFGADPHEFRDAFSRELEELTRWFTADPGRMAGGHKAVGVHQPFYLAYQPDNNRDLLARYGGLCARIMKAAESSFRTPATHSSPPEARAIGEQSAAIAAGPRKIAVGVVSAIIYTQSVWAAITKGFLLQLDRTRFDLHVFYVGTWVDEETRLAKAHVSHFEQGSKDLQQWMDLISRSNLDVLLYPEIGMDRMTVKLASLRLAPVQVVTWGHPQTSGLPTMDYFLSAEDFEPADMPGGPLAQDHYTEKLVRLPHLGCSYAALQVAAVRPDLAALGIDADSPLLLCPGSPFKYAPQHDYLYVEIARRLGKCQIVFVIGARLENVSAKLRGRLERVFKSAGLDFNRYVRFIPWQSRQEFYGLMECAAVFLDSTGFSGFNTVMQGIEAGVPVVALDGQFLRGRLGSGILKRMGLPELVAASEQDYVALVVRLARDAEYRHDIRKRIADNRHVLFNDTAPVKGLDEFLIGVTRPSRSA